MDATDCRNVAELRRLVKREIGRLAAVDRDLIYLRIFSKAEDGSEVLTAVRPGLTMAELASQQNSFPNTASHPLVAQVGRARMHGI